MRFILLCLTLLLAPLGALAEKRLGLVIGNDTYAEVTNLQKARADADAVSAALEAQGFAVTTVLDATRREMNRRISEFTGQLDPGDTAFVFYAGHGVEIDGENYLLPTDIATPAQGEKDFIKSESIALSRLLDRVRATGARTTLAIIDACRDNPFAASTGRSIGTTRGLGRINAPEGTFVIFSAGAGQTALDRLSDNDPAANSVFTRALLPQLQKPGIELRDMMADLRREVRDLALSVGHEQFPAYYDELLGQFFFTPASRAASVTPTPAAPSTARAAAPVDAIRADFELARSLNTVDAYTAFIDRYSDREEEFTVQIAMQLRDGLTGQTPDAPAPAPTPQAEEAAARTDRREILRLSQVALNALGCSAGSPDGIVGPRTRAAFADFLAETGSKLTGDALGTQAGLDAIRQHSGTICKQVAAAPKPSTSSGATATAAAPKPSAAPSYNMTGTWSWSASCPLGLKASGSTTYRSTGATSFSGSISGSAGSGTLRGSLKGRNYTASEDFGWIKNTSSGTLSADGRTLSTRVSNGCRVTARRN